MDYFNYGNFNCFKKESKNEGIGYTFFDLKEITKKSCFYYQYYFAIIIITIIIIKGKINYQIAKIPNLKDNLNKHQNFLKKHQKMTNNKTIISTNFFNNQDSFAFNFNFRNSKIINNFTIIKY